MRIALVTGDSGLEAEARERPSLPYGYLEEAASQLCSAPSLFVRHSLDVSVHCDLEIGMAQEFLNDFRVLSIGIQDRPKRTTEGVPADALPTRQIHQFR